MKKPRKQNQGDVQEFRPYPPLHEIAASSVTSSVEVAPGRACWALRWAAEGGVEIRPLRPDEHDAWLRLRERLWPDTSLEELARERAEILADPVRNGVLVVASPHGLVGFVEVSIRDWAEGCATRPVGYIEAWYVAPELRRAGLGRQLVQAAEGWARARGCTEMGSDADLSNGVSHAAHRALGYGEVARLVLFSKKLTP